MEQPIENTREIIDRLSALADHPEDFETLSRQIIEQTIASFPERHRRRARGLQFKIDAQLAGCTDPLARMNRMVEIFWEYFQQFHDIFHQPEKVLEERARTTAKIIPLHPDNSRQRSRG